MKIISFVAMIGFGVWAFFYGESLPLSIDFFNQWFSGKLLLVFLTVIFAFIFFSLIWPKGKKSEVRPMATRRR
mgnify:CR=1 FL=1